MKKSFVAILGAVFLIPYYAGAQYYNSSYYGSYQGGYYAPNNYGTSYNKDAIPRTPYNSDMGSERTIGPISVGADYVYGAASYTSKDFSVPSALTDGSDYNGNTRGFDRNLSSISFNLGFRPFKNIGIEAFYSQSLNKKNVAGVESYSYYPEFARDEYTISYRSYGVDLLGYIPINDFVEFIAAIGVGKYDMEAKIKVTAYEDNTYTKLKSTSLSLDDSVLAYRLGGGFQFWMSKHLALRVMGRWIKVGGDMLNYITEVNAGVRYHF